MRRLFTLLFAIALYSSANAISDGFYRLQCKETGRYLAIHNSYVNKESAQGTSNVDLQSLETIEGFDNIVNDPGSIIYLKNTSNGWLIEGQGFTTEGRNFYIQITEDDDSYWLWTNVTSNGVTLPFYLRDYEEEPGYSYITTDADKSTNWHWYIIPVSEDDYLGLKGDVQVGNTYYTTFYATFPIQLSAGMKAYAVNSLLTSSCTLQDIGSIVPAKTPVVIACAGEDASANKVTPLRSTDVKVEANRLSGAIFCYPVFVGGKERRSNPAWNTVDYDPETMRVLGEADGKLCFVTSDILSYVPANSAYLNVQEGSAETLPTDGTTGISSISRDPSNSSNSRDTRGTYTLNGTRLPDNATPQKGIYIENGKKVIKK